MSLSVDQLAEKHGQIAPVVVDGHRYKWQHRVADILHGWTLHDYHHQAHKLSMSDQDYLAALAAAEAGLVPHPGAVAKAPDYKAIEAQRVKLEAAAAAQPLPAIPPLEPR